MRWLPVLVFVLIAAAGVARAASPLNDLSDEELAGLQAHEEDRLVHLQIRRFEAAQRGDEDATKRAVRKMRRSQGTLSAVLREGRRRSDD